MQKNFTVTSSSCKKGEELRQHKFDMRKDMINLQIKKNSKRWAKEEKMKQYTEPIVDNYTYLTGIGFEIQQEEEQPQKMHSYDRFKQGKMSQALVKKEDKMVSFKVPEKKTSMDIEVVTQEDSMDVMLREL